MSNDSPYVIINQGNNFRTIQTDVLDLLEENKITPHDYKVWSIMLKYMEPNSTKLSISISELAKKTNIRSDNLKKIQLARLKEYNLILQDNNKDYYVNLNFASRGTKNLKYVYNLCNCKFPASETGMPQCTDFEVSLEKEKEERISKIPF